MLIVDHSPVKVGVDTHRIRARVCSGHTEEPYASVGDVLHVLAQQRVGQEHAMHESAQEGFRP